MTRNTSENPEHAEAAQARARQPGTLAAGPGHGVAGYSGFQKTVHWTTVLLAVLQLVAGFLMASGLALPDQFRSTLVTFHKSTGLMILALTAVRLVVRLTRGVPAPSPQMPAWERSLALWVHRLLYVMLFAQPLTGWLLHSAMPDQTRFYGLFPLPRLDIASALGQPQAVIPALQALHEAGVLVILGLVVLHVGGVVKHHFMDRDAVLFRMAPAATYPLLKRLRGER